MGRSFLFIFFLFIASYGFSQEFGSIKGHLMDGEMQDEPLLFAQVSLKNTSFTTETNFNGNFEINGIEAGEYTIILSYLGYETMEIVVNVESNTVTRIDRNLEAKKIDLSAILTNDTASSDLEE